MPGSENPQATLGREARDELELIRLAARQAGQIALEYFNGKKEMDVRMKGGTSPVSDADLAADRFLRDTLMRARPDYGWLSEESDDIAPMRRLSAGRSFVIDPIDGTRAFINGEPDWCVSVAVVEDGEAIAGVLDCPAHGFAYWASKGCGAYRDNARLTVRETRATPIISAPKSTLPSLRRAFPSGFEHHRHIPSLAYRIAMVADGRLDATVVKPNAHDWDIAAAELIVREAGGRLAMPDGANVELNGSNLVKPAMIAGTIGIVETMLRVVRAGSFG